MPSYSRSHFGQVFDEMSETFEFPVSLNPGVTFVVTVLPATGGVLSNYLQLSIGRWVDSNIGPGWRYPKSLNSGQVSL
jgi:hypothetical protein